MTGVTAIRQFLLPRAAAGSGSIRAARRTKLTREREQDLARRWRGEGDEAALHELVLADMRLVISTATRFRNDGLPLAQTLDELSAREQTIIKERVRQIEHAPSRSSSPPSCSAPPFPTTSPDPGLLPRPPAV